MLRELVNRLNAKQRAALRELLATTTTAGEVDEHEPIAIVGVGCRFPGGASPEDFWDFLEAGGDAIREIPEQRWDADAFFDADPHAPGKSYCRHGGFLEAVDGFEPEFFAISGAEARVMDPQQRLLLEVTWEALEHGGIAPDSLHGQPVGVFVGVSSQEFLHVCMGGEGLRGVAEGMIGTGNNSSVAAGRLSHVLDLRGPALAIDTACSSSLVALHLAARSLRSGESSLAIAGGVSLILTPHSSVISSKLMAMAPDGRCKTFDAAADGYGRGEGCGVVILERLADARAAGHRVLALLRGTAVNHDGRSSSLTAPQPGAQAEVIRAALHDAGLRGADIGLLEAHGTGTVLGDPIELQGAAPLFEDREAPLLLGSVKTNIGHLEGAAGIAGVIKAIGALSRGRVPPHLHLQRPNPEIPWAQLPVEIPRETRTWTGRRVAGVSSFSFSGTNAHVILEAGNTDAGNTDAGNTDAGNTDAGNTDAGPTLLLLSARSEAGRDAACRELGTFIRDGERSGRTPALADIAATLRLGRAALPMRAAVVADELPAAAAALLGETPNQLLLGQAGLRPPQLVFMFPGLGEQYPDMALGLYRTEPVFRQTIDRCAELLEPLLGEDIRRALYPRGTETQPGSTGAGLDFRAMVLGARDPDRDRDADALDRTRLAQPVTFAVEYALAELLQARGLRPHAAIGYSIGEYVAATIAGVLSLEDALKLVALRAKMIDELPAGAMLAVALPAEAVRPRLFDALGLSGINGPQLCVVAGPEPDIAAFEAALAKDGHTARRLRTTHAFHSPAMEPCEAPLTELARTLTRSAPRMVYASNVSGAPISAAEATDPSYWARHMSQTVRFSEGLASLLGPGRVLVEVGPGQTLGSFARAIANEAVEVVPTLRSSFLRQDDRRFFAQAQARLWLAGAPLVLPELGARVTLPTTPFQRRRYWPHEGKAALASSATPRALEDRELGARRPLERWTHVPSWRGLPPAPAAEGPPPRWIIVGEGPAAAALRRSGAEHLIEVEGAGVKALEAAAALDQVEGPLVIVSQLTLRDDADAGRRAFDDLLAWSRALARSGHGGDLRLFVLTRGGAEVLDGDLVIPDRGLVQGPARVLPQEHARLQASVVDLDGDPDLDLLARELHGDARERWVALRGGRRFVHALTPWPLPAVDSPAPAPEPKPLYLIVGGLGGVGLALAADLAAHGPCVLALVGRTLPDPGNEDPAVLARRQAIAALEAKGATVELLRGDVRDGGELRALIADLRRRHGTITGVIHAAASFSGGFAQTRSADELAAVLAPKVDGARLLAEALAEGEPPRWLLLCSSLTAVVGGVGQVDYVAANAYLDALAHSELGRRVNARTVDWDDWRDVGAAFTIVAPEPFVRWREAAREHAMRNDEGVQVFRRVLAAGLPQVAISTRSIPGRIAELAEVVERAAATMVSAPVPSGARTARPELGAAYVAPEGDDELVIARLWEELLGVEPVGRHDDFFALGGHSLLAIQLLTKLRARFGVSASLRQLFDAPTVAGVAALVGAEARGEGDDGDSTEDFDLPVRRVTLGNGLEINHVSPAETAHFYRDIFEHRGYLSHGLALPPGATVFDVGGNIGMFTLFVHCEAADARIFTFEPAPPLFRVLSRNVGEHGVRAKLFNCGVSDHEGRATFTFYPYSSGMSSIHADHQEEREVLAAIFHNQAQLGIGDRRALDQANARADELLEQRLIARRFEVPLRPLSAVIAEEGVERIDLLKVDVQKAEWEVLRGIDDGDWPKIQQVAAEVHDIDGRVAQIVSFLDARGFSVVSVQDPMYAATNIHNLYARRKEAR